MIDPFNCSQLPGNPSAQYRTPPRSRPATNSCDNLSLLSEREHLETFVKGLTMFCMTVTSAVSAWVATPQPLPRDKNARVQQQYVSVTESMQSRECRPIFMNMYGVVQPSESFQDTESLFISSQTRVPVTISVVFTTSTGAHSHSVTIMV